MTRNPAEGPRRVERPDWLSVEDALEAILARIGELGSESVPVTEALGRVLAADVTSEIAHPPWDNSAMDGYAVRSADIAEASRERPAVLRVVEEVPAGGFPTRSVGPGEAIKVMTGAPVPEGADGVTRVEFTERGPEPGTVAVFDASDAGRNIRCKGEDLEVGDRPLAAGTLVRPAEVGVLAMLGRAEALVYRRPRVGILATGDELADFDEWHLVKAGRRIMNSNSYALAAQVRECGGRPELLGIARDDPEVLRRSLERATGFDALITSAGLAVGDHDHVRDVLGGLGMELVFQRVRMRPGSPFAFGLLVGMPVFMLPGNPVSAMVTFEVLVRPALRRMTGLKRYDRSWRRVEIAQPLRAGPGRTHFYRAVLEPVVDGGWLARLTGPQGSGILTSMVKADALLRVPAGAEVSAGSSVDALVLRET
jgi:molybdopterin molybdotransferase